MRSTVLLISIVISSFVTAQPAPDGPHSFRERDPLFRLVQEKVQENRSRYTFLPGVRHVTRIRADRNVRTARSHGEHFTDRDSLLIVSTTDTTTAVSWREGSTVVTEKRRSGPEVAQWYRVLLDRETDAASGQEHSLQRFMMRADTGWVEEYRSELWSNETGERHQYRYIGSAVEKGQWIPVSRSIYLRMPTAGHGEVVLDYRFDRSGSALTIDSLFSSATVPWREPYVWGADSGRTYNAVDGLQNELCDDAALLAALNDIPFRLVKKRSFQFQPGGRAYTSDEFTRIDSAWEHTSRFELLDSASVTVDRQYGFSLGILTSGDATITESSTEELQQFSTAHWTVNGWEPDRRYISKGISLPFTFFPVTERTYRWSTDHWEPESRIEVQGASDSSLFRGKSEQWNGSAWEPHDVGWWGEGLASSDGSGYSTVYVRTRTASPAGVGAAPSVMPASVAVQNFPNPFNPTTAIRYQLSVRGHTTLVVYDALGRQVAQLVNEMKEPGAYTIRFEASQLPSGVYFARLMSGGRSEVRRMLLLK